MEDGVIDLAAAPIENPLHIIADAKCIDLGVYLANRRQLW